MINVRSLLIKVKSFRKNKYAAWDLTLVGFFCILYWEDMSIAHWFVYSFPQYNIIIFYNIVNPHYKLLQSFTYTPLIVKRCKIGRSTLGNTISYSYIILERYALYTLRARRIFPI
jgi:hypothetical protein